MFLISALVLAAPGITYGQDNGVSSYTDSLRQVYERSNQTEPLNIIRSFQSAWEKFDPAQRTQVGDHLTRMRGAAYRVRPGILDYLRAAAVPRARAAAFFAAADSAIRFDTEERAVNFFTAVPSILNSGLLYSGSGLRLKVESAQLMFAWSSLPDDLNDPPIDSLEEADLLRARTWYPESYSGARVRFDHATLKWKTGSDSLLVYGVAGVYAISDRVVSAIGAAVRWKDSPQYPGGVSFGTSHTWDARLDEPEVRIGRGRLRIPAVTNVPVSGELRWKAEAGSAKTYPQFFSYRNDVRQSVSSMTGLEIRSGVSMRGMRRTGESVRGDGVQLVLRDSAGRRRMDVRARQFDRSDSLILADNAAVSIFHGNDSIYHPSVAFEFNVGRKRVQLTKGTGQLRNVPFVSSYFDVRLSVSRLVWNLRRDSIDIYSESAVAQSPVVVQSLDYFDQQELKQLSGKVFDFHPLNLVDQYVRKNKTKQFYCSDLAQMSKKKLNDIRSAMEFLRQRGMVDYDARSGLVVAKDAGLDLMKAARHDRDYDNLRMIAVPPDERPLVSINLQRGQMEVRGLDQFTISDSLNLTIRPRKSKVVLGRNRDITFDGRVTAGNFEIHGRAFQFRYDSFQIKLNNIDSIRFLVMDKNAFGEKVRRRLSNSMVSADSLSQGTSEASAQSSGTLFINRPNNKSGYVNFPDYPRLNASAGGIFYFDRSEILGGVYDRSMFFAVPPFKLDSLSNADPGSISFKGAFVSNGILPPFRDELHTMPDRTLGFQHTIPSAGYRLYLGDGKMKGNLKMDRGGLTGSGAIDFISAHVESDQFTFYKDSVTAPGKSGFLAARRMGDVSFPQVDFPPFRLKWMPGLDSFNIISAKEPFRMYENTAMLTGRLRISTKGAFGGGKLATRGSVLKSSDMSFGDTWLSAREAVFRVLSSDSLKPAVLATGVRMKFDLKGNQAEIAPERSGDAALEFPFAQFKTSIPTARWDLTSQRISMIKADDTPIEDSYFYTTRKDLDSLAFQATSAEYDIAGQQLLVKGIPYITVADARITPENGEVLILKDARIGQLRNTTIVMDTLNGYHRLTDGVIDIVSRRSFNGYGVYNYVNAFLDTFRIRMSAFHLDTANVKDPNQLQQTVAYGSVEEADRLLLAPKLYYKGRLTMRSRKPALELDGSVRLDLKNRPAPWLMYSQDGTEQEIFVDFASAVTDDGRKPGAGLHFTQDHNLYATFIEDKRGLDDEDFFLPEGKLFYDTASSEFRIEDPRKAAGDRLEGKVFAYREEKREVKFEGQVALLQAENDFKIKASAIGYGRLDSDDVRMNALIFPEFNAPPALFNQMAQRIANIVKKESVPEGQGDPTELLYKLANLAGEVPAKEYEKRSLKAYAPLAAVPGLTKPLVFSSVDLRWSPGRRGFYSVGDLGLSHIGTTDINGAFEGFMEMRRNEDGSPVFNLFLKITPEEWYYIGYEDNRLMLNSSVSSFNSAIAKKTNAGKARPGELVYIEGSEEETFNWVNKFRKDYLDLDTPYDLNGSGAAATRKKPAKKDEKDDGF